MSGKYRTIVADPPWPFQWNGGKGGRRRRETELGYRTMTIEEIAALPVEAQADDTGCHRACQRMHNQNSRARKAGRLLPDPEEGNDASR